MTHNFKYHTIAELERLTDGLKIEIAHLRATVENHDHTSIQARTLEESEDMLRHAEFEIMERTLLK